MLRRAEPLRSSRWGGWALVESPTPRPAAHGRHWSLLILAAAALVAMAAVVFDLRIPSGPADTVGGEAVSAGAVTPLRTPTVSRPTIEPPAPVTAGPSRAAPVAAGAGVVVSGAESTASRAAASGRPAAQPAAAAPTTQTASTTDASADRGASTTTAAVDDPASRIRAYVGLPASAQLPVSFRYVVQEGDTASRIAARFGLAEATVLFNNFDIYDANHLTVGQILQLPSIDGLVYTVQPGDTLSGLEQNYLADFDATIAFPANGITSAAQIQVGQQILLVNGSASVAGGGSAGAAGGQTVQAWVEPTFLWPLAFDRVSDPFGTGRSNSFGYHTGVDLEAAVGTIVGSTAGGLVTVATWDASYGLWVEIDHGGGYRSRYAHLNEIFVSEGEWVQSNAYIGTVGNTGYSTGAHLHFEIIIQGQPVNPLIWLE